MLDFHPTSATNSKPAPEFLARPQQRKILLLVMIVGGGVLLAKLGVETAFWRELFAPPAVSPTTEILVPPQPKYYNTTLRPQSQRELPLDTFLAQAELPDDFDSEAKYFAGVQPKLLVDVRDFSPFRPAENPAWFNLLSVLRETDAAELTNGSSGPVGFVQLYEQMDIYRGQLVSVRGVVKRAFEVQAVKNDVGIEKYYQLWLFPEGGPISPIVIYALELPAGFPLSEVRGEKIQNITEHVSLVGFAFKNWIYGADQRIESAPLLLAKSFAWQAPVLAEEEPISLWMVGGFIVLTALGAFGFTVYVVHASNRLGAKANPAFAHLSAKPSAEHPLSSAEVGLTLRSLAEQVEASDADAAADLDSAPAFPPDENAS